MCCSQRANSNDNTSTTPEDDLTIQKSLPMDQISYKADNRTQNSKELIASTDQIENSVRYIRSHSFFFIKLLFSDIHVL